MSNPFEAETGQLDVLVNGEGQYSLWPSTLPAPEGWTIVLRESDRVTCLSLIRSAWTDLRPNSLVSTMTNGLAVPTGGSLPELFAGQVASHRDEIAVVGTRGHLTYSELDQRSEQLALALLARGVEPEARVAVLLDRSLDLVVALLAVVKAGAAYVPLPLVAPLPRVELILGQIQSPVLLVDEETATHPLTALLRARGVTVMRVDQPVNPANGALPVIHPEQLAYIVHTSGSTGVPKGVAITHRTVIAFATDQRWRDDSQRAVLLSSPPIFDATTYGVWVPLLGGGRVVVAPSGNPEPSALAKFIRRSGATSALLIPYQLNALVEKALDALGGLELIWTGGDIVSGAVLERLLDRFPGMRVATAWGTSETTVSSTWHPISAPYRAGRAVPVGQAMDHTRIHVLDDVLRPVPVGVSGEAYVAGIGPARGYEGRPDLTAERFVADPYGPPGSRMYRTGDLLRTLDDGNLDFVGRADQMVKVHGYRIEPGEVEASLASNPAIAQVTVVAPQDETGQRYLLAYVVPATSSQLSEAELRATAESTLPDHMVPSKFVLVDALPLSGTGKVDRKALLESLHAAV
jgi:amino acid adenylation domain-containing protein